MKGPLHLFLRTGKCIPRSRIGCPSSVDSQTLGFQNVYSQSSEWVPTSKIGCPTSVDSQNLDSQIVDSQAS